MITPKQVMELASEFDLEFKWWPNNFEDNGEGEVAFYNLPYCIAVNFYSNGSWYMHRENGVGINYTISDEVSYPTLDNIREALMKLMES